MSAKGNKKKSLLVVGSDSKSFAKKFWMYYSIACGVVVLFFFLMAIGAFGSLPSFEDLENPQKFLATEVISEDGEVIGTYYIENRSNVHYNDISPYMYDALIATEDARYEEHSGIDFRAMFRVAFGVVTGQKSGGGSTITQQLAKNLFPRDEGLSTFGLVFRKFKEWITAIKLERNYSKNEIIAMYCNTIDFGSHAFGIKSAAKTFFGKTPAELNQEEAALLVGILNAPTKYSPVRNPNNAFGRRNVVIDQMAKYEYITEDVRDSLKQIPIDISKYSIMDHNTGSGTYFREYLRGWLKEWCENHTKSDGTPYNIYKDGLKIYTTINSKMQKYAEDAVEDHVVKVLQPQFFKHWKGYKNAPFANNMSQKEIDNVMSSFIARTDRYKNMKANGYSKKEIEKAFDTKVKMNLFNYTSKGIDTIMSPKDSVRYYLYFLQTGLMAMEPTSGAVRAYVGGTDYRYFKYDHVTTARRQVGSTFKPFVYAVAMQEGELNPCSQLPNIPVKYDLPEGGYWEPTNSSKSRAGEMITLKWALANSNNYISTYLIKRYSPQAVIKLVRKMGVTSPIDPVPSICLGAVDLTLAEMVGAINTFPNKGVYVEPIFITRIEDKNGVVLEEFVPKREEVMNDYTAYLITELMKGVVQSGTGTRLRYRYGFSGEIAGKTGTTQSNSDGWFVGFVPNLTTGVWVGGEVRGIHFRTMEWGQGASSALPIWAMFMKKVQADKSLLPKSTDVFFKPQNGQTFNFDCGGDTEIDTGASTTEFDEIRDEF